MILNRRFSTEMNRLYLVELCMLRLLFCFLESEANLSSIRIVLIGVIYLCSSLRS
jgi:hypothetical protein